MVEFSSEEEKKKLVFINYSDNIVFLVQMINEGKNDVLQMEGG